MAKWVYTFGDGKAEGATQMRDLLGGKGANLAEMANLGLPVPPGFTITTEVCTWFYANGSQYPQELGAQVEAALTYIGGIAGHVFGDEANPLLVSVRSGARASMPGMMDTVLNLGLNDQTVVAVAKSAGDERFAWDSYRRFIQMYSNVVLDLGHHNFEEILEEYKDMHGHMLDTDLDAVDWREIVTRYKACVEEKSGKPFPQDPRAQLWGAVGAVFGSWMNQRAITYRRLNDIPESWGTAVNVQAMVFGNMGQTSATGVAFTRNPSTGENELYGEFLINAQGEDVVAGIRTPQNITEVARIAAHSDKPSMEMALPECFAEFVRVTHLLEKHYRDMQDMEFTVERGKLWMLQTRGGMTSHAAVVARGMGKPCVSGAGSIRVDYAAQTFTVAGKVMKKGDIITIDGSTGQVLEGSAPMLEPELSGDFAKIMEWADLVRRMKVRTNADTPADARVARNFGADGIGLCRTEHMFFEGDRIVAVREMILADDEAGRRHALAKLLPMQRQDFAALFEIMSGLPVTIRLLDPPLHEFLPHTDAEIAEVAKAMGASPEKLKRRAAELHEFNPMLGFRGVRIAIRYPEIAEMQARAIFEGAVEAGRKTGQPVTAEIMVPLVMALPELDLIKARIVAMAEAVAKESGVTVPYYVGTMIELPRAALLAADIAKTAEFFSFGTNDLTQTTLGISRDDAASFLGSYTQKGILSADPFVTLDQDGVGELVKIAAERGRATRPDIKLGICGEHGGDPASIAFCEKTGLDYVSCSPFRVPIARLAAAQAALGKKASSTA